MNQATHDRETKAAPCAEPYVGTRPFQRGEQGIFKGREGDAPLLSDKVFSSKLTLLFAGSGIGKTSLLNTLVIPQLEDQESRVFYFDDWSSERPLEILKSPLVAAATAAGIPAAGSGSPSLAELVRLLVSVDERTIILVLDQFEQLLIAHGQDLDPIKAEIAALVRAPDLDVRVVISMREEFLAAMESFRGDIVGLFQSTFRLEELRNDVAVSAITDPPEQFGGKCEPGLAQCIIDDLRRLDAAPDAPDLKSRPVPLPMLQLVCLELWKQAKAKDRVLSLTLYETAGGVEKIINDYVVGVMPKRWSAKKRTARLLLHLAPSSGSKVALTAGDLASMTDLEERNIQRELERLSKAGILRGRKWNQQVRYELQHDALIKILSPWRDRILQCEKIIKLVEVAVLGIFIFFGGYYWWQWWQSEQERQFGLTLESLLKPVRLIPPEQKEIFFDAAATYALWTRSDPERFNYLQDLLKRYESEQPPGYGVYTSGLSDIIDPPEGWPLRLRYSSQRHLAHDYFNLTWRGLAQSFAQTWGIPVPLRVLPQEDPTYPKPRLTLEGTDIKALRLEVPEHERDAYISKSALAKPGMEFLDRYRAEWTEIPDLKVGGPWWVVPRWSLPVWKVSGTLATDGSGLAAHILALKLQEHPDRLVSKSAVDLLLQRVAKTFPETVKEARAARGEKLPGDLAELVRLGRPLTGLPQILDGLAQYPADDPVTLAKKLHDELSGAPATLPTRLLGPWPEELPPVDSVEKKVSPLRSRTPDGPKKSPPVASTGQGQPDAEGTSPEPSREISEAYRSVEEWLPPVEPPIRAYVGRELERRWINEERLAPPLREAIEDLTDDMYRRFGVELPGGQVRESSWLPNKLGAWEFSLVMLDQPNTDKDAEPIDTERDRAVNRFIDALAFRSQAFRTYWVDSEFVEWQLSLLDQDLRDWLRSRYSLTDLKILLRHVVYTPDGEHIPASAQNSIRHLPWLLGSLVFWTQVEDRLDAVSLSKRLRDTQQARIEDSRADPVTQRKAREIRSGLENLKKSRLEEARKDFAAAIGRDRATAIEDFLAFYPTLLPSRLSASIEKKCRDPQSAKLSREERTYLEDRLAGSPTAGKSEHPLGRKLCLFYSYKAEERPTRRTALLGDLLTEFKAQDPLDAAPAAAFVRAVLASPDPVQDRPETRVQAVELLKRAIVALDDNKGFDVFYEIRQICEDPPGPNNWCWQALREIADLKPDGAIPLELASALSDRQRREDLELAIKLAERGERNTRRDASLSAADSKWQLDFARFSRAAALCNLAWLGDDTLAECERTLRDLIESEAVGSSAHDYLLRILIAKERLQEARAVIEQALERWPDDSEFYMRKLLVNLVAQDREAVSAVANEVMNKASDSSGALFVASSARILVGHPEAEHTARRFLAMDHPYVGFVTMMLYSFMSGATQTEANLLLQARWDRIDRASWKQRLAGGDERVWQEMLIGYYQEQVPRSEIFDALQDASAFSASDFRHLPYAREALQCEAYFYDAMLAKARGDQQRMMESLHRTVETGYGSYYEYSMAKFLLGQEPGKSPNGSPGPSGR